MEMYWFNVIAPTPSDNGNGLVLKNHQEQKEFKNDKDASVYFFQLVKKLNTGGYYYLCSRGKGAFPKDKIFGCKTPNPAKVIGA